MHSTGYDELKLLIITTVIVMLAQIVAVLYACSFSAVKIKNYFVAPRTRWRPILDCLERELVRSFKPCCLYALLLVPLFVINLMTETVYAVCQDPLLRLTMASVEITMEYEWCVVFTACLVNLFIACFIAQMVRASRTRSRPSRCSAVFTYWMNLWSARGCATIIQGCRPGQSINRQP